MSGEQLRTQAEQELHNEISAEKASLKNQKSEVPPSVKAEVTTETQKKLDTIKKEIESGKFGMESLKTHLDFLKEINNSEMKSIYLGSIITALNKKGFYVLGLNQKGINLAGGYKLNGKTAPGEEVEGYETILNNYMKSGSFSKADFQKAMLYRSSEMKNFISQNTDSTGRLLNSPNVDQYAVQLLKKYPDLDQNIQKDPEGGLMYVEKDEKIYTNWKQAMREKIKENPEDADFLVSYFDSKFYGSKEKFAGNGSPFESYKSTSQEIKTKLDTFTNSFTNEELYSLGIRNTSELQQFKTSISQDPVGTIGESIKKGFGIGIILGIIGLLFGGKKGFLVGFLGGTAIAGNSALVKDLFTKGTEAVTSGAGTFLDRVSEKYKKIAGAFSDASPEQQNIAENLFKDEKFQKAPASVLNIFNNPQFNTLDLQKTELAKYGITLTEDNKTDYETVFAGLIAKRNSDNIHVQENETVNNFLTKENDASITPATQNENTDSQDDKKIDLNQKFTVQGYTENGRNYIIGPDGSPKLIEYSDLSLDFQSHLNEVQQSGKIINNFLLLLNAYASKYPEKYVSIINELESKINTLDILNNSQIGELTNWVNSKNTELFGIRQTLRGSAIHVKSIDLKNDSAVLEHIRELDSSMANQILVEKLIHLTEITESDFNALVENTTGNHGKILKLLGQESYNNLAINVSKKKAEADQYFIENKEAFIQQLKAQNPTLPDEEINRILDEEKKPLITGSFVYAYTKNAVLESYLEQNSQKNWLGEYNGENELLKLYGDINGVGWGNISDTTSDWGKETLLVIGTELLAIGAGAITMGAGFYAVNAAVYGARGYKGIKALQLGAEVGKLAKVGKWGTMSVIEGSSFYGGYAGAQSMIEGKNMYSMDGLIDSVAFAGAFRALRLIPGLQLKPNVALSEQKLKFASVLALDTAALGAIGLGLDDVLFEPGEWTAENFIQAFAMAIMFRGMSQAGEKISLKFRKGEDGKKIDVNVNKHPLKENASFYYQGKTGTLYRVETDSKGWIKEVYNVDKKSPNRELNGVETKLSGGAKTAWIKNNIDELYKNFGVKPTQADNLATGSGNVNTAESINDVLSGEMLRKTDFIKSLLPKKAGEQVTIGDKVIKKTAEGKFEYNGKKYDKVDDIIPELSKDIKDSEIIAKINEGGAKKLDTAFNGVVNNELKIGDSTYRFRKEGGNKVLEIKNGTGWKTQSIDELSPGDAQILLDTILGKGVVSKIIGGISQKINKVKIDDVVSEKEKQSIIKRFGEGAWKKLKNEFEHLKAGNKSTSNDSFIYGNKRPDGTLFEKTKGVFLGWNQGTLTTAIGGIILNEGWEIYQAGGWDERYENYDYLSDGFDTIMNGILFKKVSLIRAIIYQTTYETTFGS